MRPEKRHLIALLLLLSTTLLWAQEHSLLDRLKDGGFNIFIRHAITPGKDPKYNPPSERPFDCSASSRQLTDEGREQSKLIGAKIRELGLPVGEVYSSSFCRCQETAQLAFGKATVVDWMVVRTGVFQAQLDRELRSIPSTGFFTKTPSGKNNIFVGHGQAFSPGVLGDGFHSRRIHLEEGEALIIEPGNPPKILGKFKFY